ncbi:MAG: hypothetical protein V2A67_06100 [Bacteroidota bacterium]
MLKYDIILLLLTATLTCQASGNFTINIPAQGFIENKGQIIDQNSRPNLAVLYLLNTPGMNVQLRRGWNFHRIDFDLIGSNPNCEIITSGSSPDYLNYYTTGTPEGGVFKVRSYHTVTYKEIYPGIDLVFNTNKATPF